MRVLSDSECEEWLVSHNISHTIPIRAEGREGDVVLPDEGLWHLFEVPSDAHTILFLAHYLAQWMNGCDVLLWITSWPLYTIPQMTLFDQYRQCLGEERRLIDAPGHSVNMTNAKDAWALGQLLQLMMIFD